MIKVLDQSDVLKSFSDKNHWIDEVQDFIRLGRLVWRLSETSWRKILYLEIISRCLKYISSKVDLTYGQKSVTFRNASLLKGIFLGHLTSGFSFDLMTS